MQTRRRFFQNTAAPVAAFLLAAQTELLAQSSSPLVEAAAKADAGKVKKLTQKYFYSREVLTDALVQVISPRGWPSDDWENAPAKQPVSNRPAVVDILIKKGADVNAAHTVSYKDGVAISGYTPLHLAAMLGEVELARVLIQHKADVNARYTDTDGTRFSVAAEAIRYDQPYVLQLLLDKGVDADSAAIEGSNAAAINNREFFNPSSLKLLHVALLSPSGEFNQNPLIIQTLFAHGVVVDESARRFLDDLTYVIPALAQGGKNGEIVTSYEKILDLYDKAKKHEKIPRLSGHEAVRPGPKPAQALRYGR